jgi:hypothetical protein
MYYYKSAFEEKERKDGSNEQIYQNVARNY